MMKNIISYVLGFILLMGLSPAMLAQEAKTKKLIIGHFSTRYKRLDDLLEEARGVFSNTHLALEGMIFDVMEE